jgi:glycosyltransferase involved in cell wall biosynthesis
MLPLPGVSVCIPVHNGARTLAETMHSVLEQTNRDLELVVMENASTDGSFDVVRAFGDPRVRVGRSARPLAPAESWNRAIELCRGQLVKLLRPDELLHPRCLEFQVAPMEADPGLAVVAARQHLIDDQSRVVVPRRGMGGLLGVRTSAEVARRVVRDGANPIGTPAGVLFRRDHFFAAGGWRGDRSHVMDLDLWMRLLQHGEFLGLPESLSAVRIDPDDDVDAQGARDEYRALASELCESPYFQVRGLDVTLGKLASPTRAIRRRALATTSRRAVRRVEKELADAATR